MAENKKSFILYCDLIHTVRKMPKGKQADLFMTILEYVNDENPKVSDLVVGVAFEPIRQQLKRDLNRWRGFREKQSEFGKKGGRPKKKKPDNESNKKGSLLDERVESLNVTATVTDTVNVIKNTGGFAPPSLEDVREYFTSKGYASGAADKAFAYYNEAGWRDSKGNKVKNWKQKMISVWFKEENKIKTKGRISQFEQNEW